MIGIWRYARIGIFYATVALAATTSSPASAADVSITLHEVMKDGRGQEIGRVDLEDSAYGLLIKPDFTGLQPGLHGLHVHQNPDCGPENKDGEVIPGGAAGGHYDPKDTKQHTGPYGDGHLGDLPNVIVEPDGSVSIPVLAPRVKVADVKGRSLMIHAGADRYSGHMQHSHGKGGTRMYCGVID
ncbi:MAG: superoxide dismutase family protein [Rhodospirillales bacterium]